MKSVCAHVFLVGLLFLLPACADSNSGTISSASIPPKGPTPDTLLITRLHGIASLPPYEKTFHNQAQIAQLYQDMLNSTPVSYYVCENDYVTYTLTFLHGSTQLQQATTEYGIAHPPVQQESCQ